MFKVRVRKNHNGSVNAIRPQTKTGAVVSAYELADLLERIPENRPLQFVIGDVLRMSPWDRPEVHSIEKLHRDGANMLFATRERGSCKMCNVADLLPPERHYPKANDYAKFICEYLIPFGVQNVMIWG